MARGRMISTTIDLDPEFNALSAGAQLIYLRTIPHLDRDGLILGNPFALWSRVAPLMEAFAPSMGKYIGEWVQQGLVIQYESKIGFILFFKGFAKNQIGLRYDRETPSVFPPPPGFVRRKTGLVREEDGDGADEATQDAGEIPEEVRQDAGEVPHEVEVELEVKEKAAAAPARACERDGAVQTVWDAWSNNMPGTLTPVLVDGINELLEDYSAREVVRAIAIACERNRRTLGYVRGVLEKGVDLSPPKSKPPPGRGFIVDAVTGERKEVLL